MPLPRWSIAIGALAALIVLASVGVLVSPSPAQPRALTESSPWLDCRGGQVIPQSTCSLTAQCSRFRNSTLCTYCTDADFMVSRCKNDGSTSTCTLTSVHCGNVMNCFQFFSHVGECDYVFSGCDWGICTVGGLCPDKDCN